MPSLFQMSSVVVDLIYRIDSVPSSGGIAMAHDALIAVGGGFNAMVAAQRAGMEVVYGGALGTGPFASISRQALSREGIPVLQPRVRHMDQGSSVVMVDALGERTFVTSAEADGYLDQDLLSVSRPSDGDWVLVSGYTLSYPDSREALLDWTASLPPGVRLVFDPSPAVTAIPEPVLSAIVSRACWVTANLSEAEVITGTGTPMEAVKALSDRIRFNEGGAIVRNGASGCWVCETASLPFHQPGFRVATIDTNGAGDAHVGTFVAGLSCGLTVAAATERANAAAALSTTCFGPAMSPVHDDVSAFLRNPHATVPSFYGPILRDKTAV